jgi:uncharacterized protein (DUF952 family)/N-acetylglutamate synthase-like GNAT family acetyltransferase
MILTHLTTADEWSRGRIAPGADGFVHLSRPDQVHLPANELYAGRRDLILLVVDADRLTSEIKVEGGFPHLFGVLGRDAVIDVETFDHDLFFVTTPPSESPAGSLLDDDERELSDMYGEITHQRREELWLPDGGFTVGWQDGQPVAVGGVRRHDDETCEICRMYVTPDARGRGVGRRLLMAVEGLATRLGYARIVLDTGDKQRDAEHIYRTSGYVEIAPYRHEPNATYFAERRLA